jgi:hypothetical protein
MRLVFVSLLVLVTILAAEQQSIHNDQPSNQPSQQQKKGGGPPKSQAPPSTTAPSGIGEPTSETVDKEKTKDRTYLKRVLSPEVLPNWLLFVVGSTGIYFAWRTLRSLEIQTGAFDISAKAAKKSAEVAEAALKLSERADVLLNHATFSHGTVLSGKDSKVVIEFKNFGRTRAQNAKLSLNLLVEGVPPTNCERMPSITMGAGKTQFVQIAAQCLEDIVPIYPSETDQTSLS